MPMPDFLIIGPPKCGTTALYATLARHPQVFMSPVKEPCRFLFDGDAVVFGGPEGAYFQRHAVTDPAAYSKLFAGAGTEQMKGEASTTYLTSYQPGQTAGRIHDLLPMVKLVAVLRHPVDRAYSAFTDMRSRGLEPITDFREALAAERERTTANWRPGFRYWQNGLYAQNLAPYYERFPRERIRIYLYEDWRDTPMTMLADLCTFLGIDPSLLPAHTLQRNVTYWVRIPWVETWIRRSRRIGKRLPGSLPRILGRYLHAWNRIQPPPLDPSVRSRLTEGYRDEILCLQNLIGRDLGQWLRGTPT